MNKFLNFKTLSLIAWVLALVGFTSLLLQWVAFGCVNQSLFLDRMTQALLLAWLISFLLCLEAKAHGRRSRIFWLFLVISFLIFSIVIRPLREEKAPRTMVMVPVAQVRFKAEELFYGADGYFFGPASNSCDQIGSMFSDPQIKALITQAESQSGFQATCYASPEAYAVSIPLPFKQQGILCKQQTVPSDHFCADSTGFAGIKLNPISGTSCDTAN